MLISKALVAERLQGLQEIVKRICFESAQLHAHRTVGWFSANLKSARCMECCPVALTGGYRDPARKCFLSA